MVDEEFIREREIERQKVIKEILEEELNRG